MPLIDGGAADRGTTVARRAAQGKSGKHTKVASVAAAIMSVMLLVSSFVTTLLIAPAITRKGQGRRRAIAFLAHRYLGPGFGTVYDLSTILILGLAGASAMAGLLHLIPRYLPRFAWRRAGLRSPDRLSLRLPL